MKKVLPLTKGDVAVILAVLLAAALSLVLFLQAPGTRASVSVDGTTVLTLSLGPDGYGTYTPVPGVVLAVDETGLRVLDADCPDRLCLGMGTVSNAGESIICVPHHLIVTVLGNGEVDGIAG